MQTNPNLSAIRAELNLTQVEMAKAIGTTFQTYHRWESGNGTPNPANRRKLMATINRLRQEQANGEGLYNVA